MSFRIFQYPLPTSSDLADLNAYLISNRVATVERHVVNAVGGPILVFVVQTLGSEKKAVELSNEKVDYREKLDPADFEVFCQLRTKRKELADAEGIPVYSVFSNAHLAAMAERRTMTVGDMGSIPGISKSRVEKYGAALVQLVPARSEKKPANAR
jgi:superfamily II DNA helicase RecQ